MSTRNNRSYTNGEITILWQANECIHRTTCFVELRSVFDPVKRPWVNPNGASSDKIKEIIEKCPTSALTFRWNDPDRNSSETSPKLFTGSIEQLLGIAPHIDRTSIVVRPNGPILVDGNFELLDEDGTPMRRVQMASLCRCGMTSNPPFCDGAHFKANFKD